MTAIRVEDLSDDELEELRRTTNIARQRNRMAKRSLRKAKRQRFFQQFRTLHFWVTTLLVCLLSFGLVYVQIRWVSVGLSRSAAAGLAAMFLIGMAARRRKERKLT